MPHSKRTRGNDLHSKGTRFAQFATSEELSVGNGAASALTDLRRDMKTLRGSHWKDIREEVARVYAIAFLLQFDEDAWLDFCRHPDWNGFRGRPKRADCKDALRYALRFAIGFSSRAATKRVSKFYNALEPLFRAKSLSRFSRPTPAPGSRWRGRRKGGSPTLLRNGLTTTFSSSLLRLGISPVR
jgi:hypothetical protein